jgi:hypothetical protein
LGALLDSIGAMVVGSLVLITILTSILNFQQLNYNIITITNLTDISEKIFKVFDQYYMANVETVVGSEPSHFSYHATLEGGRKQLVEIIISDNKTGIGYPLMVKTTDILTNEEKIDAGSYILADYNVFTYYNRDMVEVASPDSVNNVMMELTFLDKGWKGDENDMIYYYMTIWKSFKKTYLK